MSDSRAGEIPAGLDAKLIVRVTTGSRLHFGLLDTAPPFGGVGVMIESPETCIQVSRWDHFRCSNAFEARITPIVERIGRLIGSEELPACRIDVEDAAPSHFGLGSGTQISLAVAEGICSFLRLPYDSTRLVNELAMRGLRSAVGTHGYFRGGLIYEAGEVAGELNPTLGCVTLPEAWTVLVMRPTEHQTIISGKRERENFATLSAADSESAKELRHLVSTGIIAGAQAEDFTLFASSVRRYNEQSGQLFAAVQGGAYNGPAVTRTIEWLAGQGVLGYGQSSWGPGVFAWCKSESQADELINQLPADIDLIAKSKVRNRPRILDQQNSDSA